MKIPTAPYVDKTYPADTYPARCVRLYDLGTHQEVFNQESKDIHKVQLVFEIMDDDIRIEVDVDGKMKKLRRFASIDFTMSMDKRANLYKVLKGWRGKDFTQEELEDFDLDSILDKPCMLTIERSESKWNPGRFYNNITAIGGVPKGMKVPKLEAEAFSFSIEANDELRDEIPEWVQEKITSSYEWLALQNDGLPEIPEDRMPDVPEEQEEPEDEDDNLPF